MIMLILKSMRPYQWYKNLVLFAGLIFAGNLFVFPSLAKAGGAFLIFCLLSGAGYILNDVADVRADSCHHEKSKRPIASGEITVKSGIISSVFIFVLGNGSAFLLSHEFGWCALSYSVITILYSVFLKKIVLIDVITISVGFVVRAVAGAVVIDVYISPWLILCAFMLSLFLALCKRKQDKSSLYTPVILDHLLSITTTLLIMSYSLYTFLRATQEMMVTIPLVLYGLFRFLILFCENDSTKIELFFLDKGLLLTFFLWVLLVVFLVYT
jgi:4-hydroxybenzoate polyprenyltransferase